MPLSKILLQRCCDHRSSHRVMTGAVPKCLSALSKFRTACADHTDTKTIGRKFVSCMGEEVYKPKSLFKRTQQCWLNIMQQFSNSVLCCFFCKYFNASSFNWNKSYRIIKTFEKQAVEPSVSSLLGNVRPTLLGPFEQA